MALFSALLLVSAVDANVAVEFGAGNYTEYKHKNCYDGHGAVNIDTNNSPSPPAANITLEACLQWCDKTALDHCPRACDCVVFTPHNSKLGNPAPNTMGVCYRRSNCKLDDCPESDDFFAFAKNHIFQQRIQSTP